MMSRENVQFLEMVKERYQEMEVEARVDGGCAAAPVVGRRMYCQVCGVTAHTMEVHGEWEVYRCGECGSGKSYRVR